MFKIKPIIRKTGKGIMGLLGLRLIDPIEVFYLKDHNIFYPIISKSGCSSVKLTIIKEYNKEFYADFPDIHHIDPANVTNGKVKRLYFYNIKNYKNFAREKTIYLVLRDPFQRFSSCYWDIKKEKNIMYKYPSGLNRFISISKDISPHQFLNLISFLPDRLSDRHFRSQAFYFPCKVKRSVKRAKIFTIREFIQKFSDKKQVKLNMNSDKAFSREMQKLKKSRKFYRRYKSDLFIYNTL